MVLMGEFDMAVRFADGEWGEVNAKMNDILLVLGIEAHSSGTGFGARDMQGMCDNRQFRELSRLMAEEFGERLEYCQFLGGER